MDLEIISQFLKHPKITLRTQNLLFFYFKLLNSKISINVRDIRITGSIEIERDINHGIVVKEIVFDNHFDGFTVR